MNMTGNGNEVIKKVKQTIKKYNMLAQGERVIIGVSGGADSVCLTDILNRLKEEYGIIITLVHINHNIRGEEAKRDEDYVVKLGEKYGNDVKVFSYEVEKKAKEEGLTVEEEGRKLRYEAFYKTAGKNGKIAVAHNMNDNCETMLMRFFRGTGVKGLGGISASRDRIIRPLISISRKEIEEYCNERGLDYCTDSTNSIEEYTRNKIRLNIIPWIKKEFNENIEETMARTGQIMSEEEKYMESQAEQAYKDCEIEEKRISVERFLKYDRVIQRRIVRLGFREYSADLHDVSYEHVERVISLGEKESGRIIELPGGLRAIKEYNTILFYKAGNVNEYCYNIEIGRKNIFREIGVGIEFSFVQNVENEKKLYTIALDYDKIRNKNILLRGRRKGDRISLYGGRKTIKKLFIDEKIPVSKRNNIPLLAVESDVIWIKDMKVSYEYKAREETKKIIYLNIWEV